MKNLYKALAKFQQEVPVIEKGTKGYGYSYSDLPTIFGVINPLLQKHGLGFYQAINETIETTIFHIDTGESITSKTEIPKNVSLKGMNDFQVLGSAITYIRRYALSSMLGLVTDKDVDAGGIQIVSKSRLEEIKKTEFSDLKELAKFYNTLNSAEKSNEDIKAILKDKQIDLKQM